MKILKPGRKQKGWATRATCTGNGNGGGGCGAKLLVEEGDLFQTSSHHYDGSSEYYVTFRCKHCGVDTDITNYHGHRTLPKKPPRKPQTTQQMPQNGTFAFTVECQGSPWDVHYFEKDGKKGTLAFREREGKFEIGVFKAGELPLGEVLKELQSAVPV